MGFGQVEQPLAGPESVPRRFHPHVLVRDVAGGLARGEVAMPLELGRHILDSDAPGDERRRHRRGRRHPQGFQLPMDALAQVSHLAVAGGIASELRGPDDLDHVLQSDPAGPGPQPILDHPDRRGLFG